MIEMIKAAKYKNYYTMIEIYNNVDFLIKILVTEVVFPKTWYYSMESIAKLSNLFSRRMTLLLRDNSYKTIFFDQNKTRHRLYKEIEKWNKICLIKI